MVDFDTDKNSPNDIVISEPSSQITVNTNPESMEKSLRLMKKFSMVAIILNLILVVILITTTFYFLLRSYDYYNCNDVVISGFTNHSVINNYILNASSEQSTIYGYPCILDALDTKSLSNPNIKSLTKLCSMNNNFSCPYDYRCVNTDDIRYENPYICVSHSMDCYNFDDCYVTNIKYMNSQLAVNEPIDPTNADIVLVMLMILICMETPLALIFGVFWLLHSRTQNLAYHYKILIGMIIYMIIIIVITTIVIIIGFVEWFYTMPYTLNDKFSECFILEVSESTLSKIINSHDMFMGVLITISVMMPILYFFAIAACCADLMENDEIFF